MSHKKRTHQNTHQNSSRENKRAQFAAPAELPAEAAPPPPPSDKTKILFVVMAALVGVVAYLVMSGLDDRPTASAVRVNRQASAPAAAPASAALPASAEVSADAGGDVVIPVSQLGGKASFFEYQTAAGKDVRFFVMKSSDGVYRAALDSCDVCFAGKKGYRQDGDDMVCQKCGNRFPSVGINEVHGGCNPVALTRKVEGDKLVIKAGDLEKGNNYF